MKEVVSVRQRGGATVLVFFVGKRVEQEDILAQHLFSVTGGFSIVLLLNVENNARALVGEQVGNDDADAFAGTGWGGHQNELRATKAEQLAVVSTYDNAVGVISGEFCLGNLLPVRKTCITVQLWLPKLDLPYSISQFPLYWVLRLLRSLHQ